LLSSAGLESIGVVCHRVNSGVRCFALSRKDVGMRLDVLIRSLLITSIVLLVSSFIVLNASALQSKVSLERRIYSCREVKKLYPELEKLSDDELRKYLSEKFLSQYNSNPMETYTHAKYYVCRCHNDNSEQVDYMKKWVVAFEKKLKDKDNHRKECYIHKAHLTTHSTGADIARMSFARLEGFSQIFPARLIRALDCCALGHM
jgi:hypothetical protein